MVGGREGWKEPTPERVRTGQWRSGEARPSGVAGEGLGPVVAADHAVRMRIRVLSRDAMIPGQLLHR